ncbi:MAG: nickel-responsive transcriptional regulator NikR [Spirochaetales bacterium]|nr:nickel-responsive transcriptional regulator NikR [Spirochaetales bacterium]
MLTRFGISLENNLLKQFDKHIQKKGYLNRSEALRDLIRDALVNDEWLKGDKETTAIVIIIFDHHQYTLAQKITGIQHDHFINIIASMHSHLDEHNCLEVILLKGKGHVIQEMANNIISMNGVKFGRFIPASAGKNLE